MSLKNLLKKLLVPLRLLRTASQSAVTGPAPLWWTVLVAAGGAYAMKEWGVPLCP